MSVEKIIQSALANEPVQMKKHFEEEIAGRVTAALEAKYQEMSEAKVKEEDEEEDEDEVEKDDEDEEEEEDDE